MEISDFSYDRTRAVRYAKVDRNTVGKRNGFAMCFAARGTVCPRAYVEAPFSKASHARVPRVLTHLRNA